MLTKQKKEEVVSELTDKISRTKSVVFVEFTGMSTAQISALRRELKENDAELKVAKKTLVDLALRKNSLEADLDQFKTQVAVALGYNDEVGAVKILAKLSRTNKALKMLAGFVGGEYYGTAPLSALAKLPSREQLLGQLVGTIAAPISGFANVLQGNIRGLVTVLSKIKQ
jgi:large subunit ribosomal protein L10